MCRKNIYIMILAALAVAGVFLYYGRERRFVKGDSPERIWVMCLEEGDTSDSTFYQGDREYTELEEVLSEYRYRNDLDFAQKHTLDYPAYMIQLVYPDGENEEFEIGHDGYLWKIEDSTRQIHIGLRSRENIQELYTKIDKLFT